MNRDGYKIFEKILRFVLRAVFTNIRTRLLYLIIRIIGISHQDAVGYLLGYGKHGDLIEHVYDLACGVNAAFQLKSQLGASSSTGSRDGSASYFGHCSSYKYRSQGLPGRVRQYEGLIMVTLCFSTYRGKSFLWA